MLAIKTGNPGSRQTLTFHRFLKGNRHCIRTGTKVSIHIIGMNGWDYRILIFVALPAIFSKGLGQPVSRAIEGDFCIEVLVFLSAWPVEQHLMRDKTYVRALLLASSKAALIECSWSSSPRCSELWIVFIHWCRRGRIVQKGLVHIALRKEREQRLDKVDKIIFGIDLLRGEPGALIRVVLPLNVSSHHSAAYSSSGDLTPINRRSPLTCLFRSCWLGTCCTKSLSVTGRKAH